MLDSGPLPANCTCTSSTCDPWQVFWHTVHIQVDIVAFSSHIESVMKQWRAGPEARGSAYATPLTKHEAEMRAAMDTEQWLQDSPDAVQCM